MKKMKDMLSQIMGSIGEPIEIESGTCPGCHQKIKLMQSWVIGGTEKGKPFTFKKGCICEELKLAEETREVQRQAKIKKKLEIFTSNSLVSPSLKHATFETYEPKTKRQQEIMQVLYEYIGSYDSEQGENILITGPYGTGKSHLCIATIKEFIKLDKTVAFITVPKLFSKLKESFDARTSTRESDIMTAIEEVEVLVLDDIGAEAKNDWRTEKLLEIIDSRAGKHTLYTTNKNSNELIAHLGERNFSKLTYQTKILVIDGQDKRSEHLRKSKKE